MAIYLIDYENVYIEGLTGLESLTKEDEVIIFYTQNRCGLTFELHRRLISCQASLQLMEVSALSNRKNTVKNALDLQLSMYIGYLIGSRPSVPLYIISKDTDFDLNLSFYMQYLQQGGENLSIYTTIAQTFAASDSDAEEQSDFAKPEKSEAKVAAEESKKQKPTVQSLSPKELQIHVSRILGTNDAKMVCQVCSVLTAAEDLVALNNMLIQYYRDGKRVKEIYHELKPFFAQFQTEESKKKKSAVQSSSLEKFQAHVSQLLGTNDKAMVRRVCAALTASESLVALNNHLARYYHDGKQVKEIYHKLKPSFAQLRKEATQK